MKQVDVSSNQITDKGAESIAKENQIATLEVLNLCNNRISTVGFEFLIKSKAFPALQDISLDMNKIENTQQLSYECQLDNILRFSVRDNKFGPRGCFYIQVYAFRNLTYLNLGRNNITDAGVEKLAQASYFRQLQTLILDDNQLGHFAC